MVNVYNMRNKLIELVWEMTETKCIFYIDVISPVEYIT